MQQVCQQIQMDLQISYSLNNKNYLFQNRVQLILTDFFCCQKEHLMIPEHYIPYQAVHTF